MSLIGIFGGTFDPPHLGHEFIIRSLLKTLPFEEIKVVPTGIPPHRSFPIAKTSDRYKMTALMIDSIQRASLDEREIVREGPCYTVDTLSEFRMYFGPDVSLALIVGLDAFSGFPKWHLPHKILELAHVIVIPRAGVKLIAAKRSVREALIALDIDPKRQFSNPKKLACSRNPSVYMSGIAPPDISSTLIRQKILQGCDIKSFVPDKVWEYIKRNHLYSSRPTRTSP